MRGTSIGPNLIIFIELNVDTGKCSSFQETVASRSAAVRHGGKGSLLLCKGAASNAGGGLGNRMSPRAIVGL